MIPANRYLHYTHAPIGDVHSCSQEGGPHVRPDKPRGLWLSVAGEDDWRSWCEAASFGDLASAYCYEVALRDDANILHIADAPALLAFGKRYAIDPYMGPMGRRTIFAAKAIDWVRVAAQYDGIVIAPYQRSLRLDERVRWYYGWDCASGCVWTAAAIAGLRLVSDAQETT